MELKVRILILVSLGHGYLVGKILGFLYLKLNLRICSFLLTSAAWIQLRI